MVKEYSVSDRNRIWNKLQFVIWRYPGKSWGGIADEISVFRGYRFDRKYFSRLRSGSLGDARVNDIVEWISDKFDRTFKFSFGNSNSTESLSQQHFFPRNPPGDTWHTLKDDEITSILQCIMRTSAGSFFECKHISGHFQNLSFLSDTKLVRITSHKLFSPVELFFTVSEGKIDYFNGSKSSFSEIERSSALSLSSDNYLSAVAFVLKYVEGKKIDIITSVDTILDHYQKGGLNHRLSAEKLLDIFEAPRLETKKSIQESAMYFDAVQGDVYSRYKFFIGGSLSDYQFEEFVVSECLSELLTETSQRPQKINAKIPIRNHSKLQPLFEIIETSDRVGMLTQLIKSNMIDVILIEGAERFCSFDLERKSLLLIAHESSNTTNFELAIELLIGLRAADIELVQGAEPDPMTDLTKYAGYAHARNLDTLSTVFEVFRDWRKQGQFSNEISNYLSRSGMTSLYNSWKRCGSPEKFYDHYADWYESRSNPI